MSHRKDTDYLAVSARIRAMENRLLTRERMDRIIDARDDGEARKVLTECGYPDAPGMGLESVLAQVREQTRKELLAAIPDGRLLEIFTLKYDYHNAKAILKAEAMGDDPERLLLTGGRYEPAALLAGWQREQLGMCSDTFRKAMEQAAVILKDNKVFVAEAHNAVYTAAVFLKFFCNRVCDCAAYTAADNSNLFKVVKMTWFTERTNKVADIFTFAECGKFHCTFPYKLEDDCNSAVFSVVV